jgi:hypothetical protein
MKRARDDAQPSIVTSACGRVTATVTPGKSLPMVSILFPYPELDAKHALSLVVDRLPARFGFMARSNREFSLEEYEAWIARDGPQTDGTPLFFGRYEQTVH